MAPEPLTTYLELRESTETGEEAAGLSHKPGGLFLLHVLEVAAHGEPRGGVTIVHDAGDHGGRYLKAADALAEAGWAVALPDLRGHGRSEGERGHGAGRKEVVRDLEAVQQHLAYRLPTAPRALIGVGLGAIYCLAHALDHPGSVAALVLIGPRWKPRFELPQPASGLKKLFKKVGPTSPGRVGVDPAALTTDPAEQAAWKSDELVHDVVTLGAGRAAEEIAGDCLKRLNELSLPVLVLHGADDAIAPPGDSCAAAPEPFEVRVEEGMRHDLLHEKDAARILTTIRDWLAEKI